MCTCSTLYIFQKRLHLWKRFDSCCGTYNSRSTSNAYKNKRKFVAMTRFYTYRSRFCKWLFCQKYQQEKFPHIVRDNHAYLSIEKYPKTQITKFEKSAFVRYQYLLNYSLYLLVKVFLQTAPKNYGSLKRDNSGLEDIDGRDKYWYWWLMKIMKKTGSNGLAIARAL